MTYDKSAVRIVDFQETRVAVLEHHGEPEQTGASVRRFIEWRRKNRLPLSSSATFNIVYNDPATVAPEQYRIDLCAATDRDIGPNEYGIMAKTIPAGRCAVLRHVGSDDGLGSALYYLLAEWLPKSGEQMRDFPLFFQRIAFFPDVAEGEAVTDLFVPLK